MKPWVAIQIISLVVLLTIVAYAFAQIPADAERYKRDLIRNSRLEWGLNAPTATLGSQIQQESGFNSNAVSGVGAVGLAQFMPSTAKWISGAYPALADNEPRNPVWALRAQATYTKYLWDRTESSKDCDHGAKMLASYNSGEGWLHKDEAICRAQPKCAPLPQEPEDDRVSSALKWVWTRTFGAAAEPPKPAAQPCGCASALWWGHVERFNAPGRSESNWHQSRDYATRILKTLEPRYVEAGWGLGLCAKQ